ncbi:MAG TPA: hypothetical protein VFM18_15205 [Methanosarcina sp.]|nr:hypothetical protein [Methanosarcina sp.]
MEVLLVYLWLKIDTFRCVLGILFGLSLVAGLIYMMSYFDQYGEAAEKSYTEKFWPGTKRALTIGIISVAIAIFCPSSKDTAILVGTSYAIDLAKSPEGSKVMTLIRAKANQYLDDAIKESQPKQSK